MKTDRSRFLSSSVAAGLVAASLSIAPLAATAAAPGGEAADRKPCTIIGTPGRDVLRGGPRADVICGRGGDDVLIGNGGDDELRGGPGDDVLRGGAGSDLLRGGRGNDRLIGDDGGDRLRGHAGSDLLLGGPGDDRLSGGRGPDRLEGGLGADVLLGGPGDDHEDAQDAPTAVRLTAAEITENHPAGTEVGRLVATDADADDTHRFSLVPGAGDADNAAFSVDGDRLRTSRPLDFEAASRLTLRVQATDPTGLAFTTSLEVVVRDVVENGAPVAHDDSTTLDEDAAATEVDVLGNDTDPDRDPLVVVAVDQATGGTVTLSGGRVAFRPESDRCGPAAGGFRYTVSDGRDGTATARVRVDLTCLPDPTVAHDDAVSVDEDAAATQLDVLGNDTDPDGEPLTVASATAPAHGVTAVVGGRVTYRPDPDYCGPDSFDYTVAGGDGATVDVTVTCVDDAPVAVDDELDLTEDAAATTVPVRANDTDIDGGPKTVVSVTQPSHGEVVLADGAVTYEPDADHCGADSFTYALGGGATATVAVTVECVDDAPVAVDDTLAAGEDAGWTFVDVTANDTDVDGGELVVAVGAAPQHGVVTASAPGLQYMPEANYCGSDSFGYVITGGSQATVHVTVACIDDAPVAHDDAATTLVGTGVDVDLLANDTDVDGGPMTAELATAPSYGTVTLLQDGTADYTPTRDSCGSDPVSHVDTFTYRLSPGGSEATVEVTVTCVDDAPVAVDDAMTVAEDAGATEVDVLANEQDPDGGPKAVSAVTQGAHGEVVLADGVVTYEPEADFCGTDTFTYDLSPGDTTATVTVTVTCADDAPVGVDDSATVLEDAQDATIEVLANDTDIDAGPRRLAATLAAEPAHGIVEIAQDGSGLTYSPDADYCGSDEFTYTLNGGSSGTVTVTVTCVNDAPSVPTLTLTGADAAIGNTTLVVDTDEASYGAVTGPAKTVTADLLDGATDVDGPGPLEIVADTITTDDGGTVDLRADGTFGYRPAGSAACGAEDEFDYTVSDGGTPAATTTATVRISVSDCVWYVDNTAATGGDGTSDEPFDTLAEAQAAVTADDIVFVYAGDGTSTGYGSGMQLLAGQQLVGEVAGLSVRGTTLVPATAGKRPVLTATNQPVVALGAGNVVTGLRIDPAGGSGVEGLPGDADGALSDLEIVDTGTAGVGAALNMFGTSGTFDVSGLVVDSRTVGVQLQNAGTVRFTPSSTVRITTTGARGLVVLSTAVGTSEFDQVTVAASTTGAVQLGNVTGSTTFGGLDLVTSGATPAFALSNAGSVSIVAAGTANVRSSGGPAVDVTGTAGAVLSFDVVYSSDSATDGVNLAGLGSGTFSAGSGSFVTRAAGISFDLDGGSGDVTWAAPLGDGPGSTVEITGRTGGAVLFSGNVVDGTDAGGGISLSGNTGGSTTFSGGVNRFETGASPAVVMTGSGGHDLAFTGGTLTITATSGTGLRAAGSGSVSVTGAANTITTTTGVALDVSTTRIASAGLTFQRISSTGAPVGILLDRTGKTGADGSLSVTGSGGTCQDGNVSGCTGGTIANGTGPDSAGATPTGSGIVRNQTKAPSFTRVQLFGHSNYGIRGTAVAGFALADSVVVGGSGNAAAPYHDSAISFTDLTGSASFSRVDVEGGASDNLRVVNGSGSLDRLMVDDVTFDVAGNTPANDALTVQTSGTAALRMTVQNSTFKAAAGDLLQVDHVGSGAADVVVTGSTFSNQHPAIADGGGGVSLTQSGASGPGTMSVTSNTFTGAVGHAVSVVKGNGPATQVGTFAANSIGATGSASSGSVAGDGLRIQSLGQGSSTWMVRDNIVRQYAGAGISVRAGGSGVATGGAVDVTVRGNTLAERGAPGGYGIEMLLGTTTGDSFLGCAAVTGNTVAAAGDPYDISLRQRYATTLRLPGYAGAATDTTAASAYVDAGNGGSNTVQTLVSGPPTGGGVTGGGPSTCTEPAA